MLILVHIQSNHQIQDFLMYNMLVITSSRYISTAQVLTDYDKNYDNISKR